MIEIRDLHYQYPDGTMALSGINLEIPSGNFLLVCGANGSGKTTLIRHINGLIKPARGSVFVDGLDVSQSVDFVSTQVGMVFQDADSQIIGETVWEDAAFGPENLGISREEVKERVESALKLVGLDHLSDRPCHLLSGGEKRRLAIAGVLAMGSRIIILDEPFANLDYPGIRQILHQLIALHRAGHTIVITTHDIEKAVAHADRIAVLKDGELKAIGLPGEIIQRLPLYGIRQPCSTLLGMEVISWLD